MKILRKARRTDLPGERRLACRLRGSQMWYSLLVPCILSRYVGTAAEGDVRKDALAPSMSWRRRSRLFRRPWLLFSRILDPAREPDGARARTIRSWPSETGRASVLSALSYLRDGTWTGLSALCPTSENVVRPSTSVSVIITLVSIKSNISVLGGEAVGHRRHFRIMWARVVSTTPEITSLQRSASTYTVPSIGDSVRLLQGATSSGGTSDLMMAVCEA